MVKERTVLELAELIGYTKSSDPKVCLFIGAGVSRTAGIGLANDFIERIKQRFPQVYEHACREYANGNPASYAQCMASLTSARQVELVRADIDQAQINWAHIGLARLERQGIIDTILTTNFDPLASRACALFNRFPAIYDLAGLRDGEHNNISFDRSYVKGIAIFHLHGQHTGFLLLNTDEKLKIQARRIKTVLDAVMKGKPVIIAGYSGENDPLVDEIAALAPFNQGLFWITHNDQPPAKNVCTALLSKPDCYLVKNMPSDRFFTELANALSLNSPGFLVDPFQHMLGTLDTIRPFSDAGLGSSFDLLQQARDHLSTAKQKLKEDRPYQHMISEMMSTGQYQEIWDEFSTKLDDLAEEDRRSVAWSAVMMGNRLSDAAEQTNPAYSADLFSESYKWYERGIQTLPTLQNALNNWGLCLLNESKIKSGKLKNDLIKLAEEKMMEAESILEGSAAYNLACLHSIKRNAEESSKWLLLAYRKYSKFPTCEFINNDSDFNNVRNSKEFLEVMNEIGCQNS